MFQGNYSVFCAKFKSDLKFAQNLRDGSLFNPQGKHVALGGSCQAENIFRTDAAEKNFENMLQFLNRQSNGKIRFNFDVTYG